MGLAKESWALNPTGSRVILSCGSDRGSAVQQGRGRRAPGFGRRGSLLEEEKRRVVSGIARWPHCHKGWVEKTKCEANRWHVAAYHLPTRLMLWNEEALLVQTQRKATKTQQHRYKTNQTGYCSAQPPWVRLPGEQRENITTVNKHRCHMHLKLCWFYGSPNCCLTGLNWAVRS